MLSVGAETIVLLGSKGYLKVSLRDGDNYSNIFVSIRESNRSHCGRSSSKILVL